MPYRAARKGGTVEGFRGLILRHKVRHSRHTPFPFFSKLSLSLSLSLSGVRSGLAHNKLPTLISFVCGQSRRLQSIGICFTLYAQIILVKGITLGVNNEAFVALRSEPSNYNNISLPLPSLQYSHRYQLSVRLSMMCHVRTSCSDVPAKQ